MTTEAECDGIREKIQEKLPDGWTAEAAILEEGNLVVRLRPEEGETIRCIFDPKAPEDAVMATIETSLEHLTKDRIQV